MTTIAAKRKTPRGQLLKGIESLTTQLSMSRSASNTLERRNKTLEAALKVERVYRAEVWEALAGVVHGFQPVPWWLGGGLRGLWWRHARMPDCLRQTWCLLLSKREHVNREARV